MKKTLTGLSVILMASAAAWAQAAPKKPPAAKPPAAKPAADKPELRLDRLDQLLQKVQADPGGTSEGEAMEMLRLAKEQGRSYLASLAMGGYLQYNFRASASLLLAAADTSYRAGDYGTAVGRYKTYLASATPSEEAGAAAANLYTILVDFLGAEEDAYAFLSKTGYKFRSLAPARRWDGWFLSRAMSRRDYTSAARVLSAALADKLPVEQERLYYGNALEWLMRSVASGEASQFAALPDCKAILAAVRHGDVVAARYGFRVAKLSFAAGAAGKDEAALARDFDLVSMAAQKYLAASPTPATVQEIVEVLGGGIGKFDDAAWEAQKTGKQALFVAMFSKLDDAGKAAILGWTRGERVMARFMASPAQWADLGARNARLFSSCPAARLVAFNTQADSIDAYKAQAAFLAGVPSASAAAINALAVGDDITKVIDHLAANEAWHLPLAGWHDLLTGEVFPAFEKLAKAAKKDLPADWQDQAWLHFGANHLSQTPIAIYDAEAVKAYLRAAWKVSGKDANDKSRVAKHLETLAWVAFDAGREGRGTRGEVFGVLANDARWWAENVRNEARRKTVDEAVLNQIAPLEQAIRKARGPAEPAKAPNELCRALAEMVMARQDPKADPAAAERKVYQLVRDYPSKHTPCGADAFRIAAESRAFNNLDVQVEMLADQLAAWKSGESTERLDVLMSQIFSGRQEWRMGDIHERYRAQALQVNAALEKGLAAMVAQGRFSDKLFAWFRGTRAGRGWRAGEAGEAVMDQIIQKKLFSDSPYRVERTSSATVSYMKLIRDEFPNLDRKYPLAGYFDDLFVAEAEKTRHLDWAYWEFGTDTANKVKAAAAKILAEMEKLPSSITGDEEAYSITALNRWMDVALKGGKAARDNLLARLESYQGKTRFDVYALGYGAAGIDDPRTAEGRKLFFEKLGRYVDRSATAPARLGMPYLGGIADLKANELTDGELNTLVKMFADAPSPWWSKGWSFDVAARLVHEGLLARKREAELFPLVGQFWKVARDSQEPAIIRMFTDLTDALRRDRKNDLALAYGNVALSMMKASLPDDARGALANVRSAAISEMGGVIPVAKGHPLRGLYEAQLAYLTGRQQTAWETYLANRGKLVQSFKDFDPQFCIWIIDRETEFRNFEPAESLAREMRAWFDESSTRFEAEVRARMELAYANIAIARGDYPRARALLETIVANKGFAGARAHTDAELKIADVDIRTAAFDKAIERLDRLARKQDKYIQAEAYYYLALAKYTDRDYPAAKEHLDSLFTINPDHADGKILQGRNFLALRKLEQPTDIELGDKIGRKFIVPGKPVRVTLVDNNLSIVRKAREIEIRAWTDSGDEEFFTLKPFGDSRTKFKGQIDTVLGEVKKENRVVEVIGKDRVHYAFSEKFAREQQIEKNEPYTLEVATDALLYASSGKILSKEEREAIAMEEMIKTKAGVVEEKTAVAIPLSTVRSDTQIKPGNKVNVRVDDPDRGETTGKDTISVRVSATSGDAIEAFVLTETSEYSGSFRGAVPTEAAQARAYASDSLEGTEANFTISARDYPAWVGLPRPTKSRPKLFSVDLNDNVAADKMKIVAKEAGRKLKSFLVQTSLNAEDFTTVGAYPDKHVPWDGTPRIEIAEFVAEEPTQRVAAPTTAKMFDQYFEQGVIREGKTKYVGKLNSLDVNWDSAIAGLAGKIGLQAGRENNKYYAAHISLAFYQTRRQVRKFTLAPRGESAAAVGGRGADPLKAVSYLIAFDGEVAKAPQASRGAAAGTAGEPAGIVASRTVSKGVHRLDIYVFANQQGNPNFEVRVDSDKPPYEIAAPLEMFDPARNPEIGRGLARQVATVTANPGGTEFDVQFPADTQARVVRLLIADFEGDAPAINKISLTNRGNVAVLPTKFDFMELRKNNVLEIVPGDRVTVTYKDPKVITQGRDLHEAFLNATYTDGSIDACFVEYAQGPGGARSASYIPMRRFEPGDKVNVFIRDPDADVSDKLDTVTFDARTSEGKPVKLTALETAEHSGVFLGSVFPVKGDPNRPSELKVVEGDDIILIYLDRENTNPGIAWERTASVEQAWYETPEVRVYDVTSLALEEADKLAGRGGAAGSPARGKGAGKAPAKSPGGKAAPRKAVAEVEASLEEDVPARRALMVVRPEKAAQDKPSNVVIGGPLLVEVLFPSITKSPQSACSIYVQTSSGRKKSAKPVKEPFDIEVPGTLKLTRAPGDAPAGAPPAGYREVVVHGNPYALTPLDDGRYMFAVPVKLGAVPDKSMALEEDAPAAGRKVAGADQEKSLYINGEDTIHIGLQYKDPNGKEHWATRQCKLSGDFFFDVMDRRYQELLKGLYVGENLYFRLIDPTRDATDEKDAVEVEVFTKSGQARKIPLIETYSHSGVFKSLVKIIHSEDREAAKDAGTMPAVYGDLVTAKYVQPKTEGASQQEIEVFKGSDGLVTPFTKRFKDPAIAVQTQFMIAEAYFELAKRHRQLKQDDVARKEIAQGRKLLEEAIRDYPDTAARAQAEYLLADLSMEFGNDAVNEEIRKKYYVDAISRYSDIVAAYGDSEYAPKAQFRKALAFEKMTQIDEACEEYVKLSYRYPDNPLVAETIARLGQYFLNKGRQFRAEMDKEADAVRKEKIRMNAVDMFNTAGDVFGRLSVRFPAHRLAGKTLLLSAQCFMQAEDWKAAIAGYQKVIKALEMDKDLVAEAMYWCGHSYMETAELVEAYRVFKKLTWDFPGTKWSKFALGRLADERLANIKD
jgi:TolA-binding protein